MNREDILVGIYNDPFYRGYITKLTPYLIEECYSEFLLEVSEMCETKLGLLHSYNELKYYSISIIRNMVYNKYSNFNKMYNEKLADIDNHPYLYEDNEEVNHELNDELVNDIKDFLTKRAENVDGAWYDKQLFKMYFEEDETFRSISEMTSIPTSSIFHNIKGTQSVIQQKFKKRYDDL